MMSPIEKHRPTMFHTGTVRPERSGPNILYNTSLSLRARSLYSMVDDSSNLLKMGPTRKNLTNQLKKNL